MPKDCCSVTGKENGSCVRKSDKKEFELPRKYSKKDCLSKNLKGFTARSSCAPFKDCKKSPKRLNSPKKREFFFNPNNKDKSFDVYIDKNPKDTIPVKYSNLQELKSNIRKLEKLYREKKYTHKRIGQVAMVLRVRLRVLKNKKREEYLLAERYCDFLKERTKKKTFEERTKLKFKI